MKLASKYLIALGAISTVAAGAIGYGTYSAVKFNEKFQGNGWYYDGVKFDTEDEAVKEFKSTIVKNYPEYFEVTMSLDAFASKTAYGTLGHSMHFDDFIFKVSSSSEIGKRITGLQSASLENKIIAFFSKDTQKKFKVGNESLENKKSISSFSAFYKEPKKTTSSICLSFNGSKINRTINNDSEISDLEIFKNNLWKIESTKNNFLTSSVSEGMLIGMLTDPANTFAFPRTDINFPEKTPKITKFTISSLKSINVDDVIEPPKGKIIHII